MAVLDRFRDFWSFTPKPKQRAMAASAASAPTAADFSASDYSIQPLTLAQLDELWLLDQRCFVNGEAYTRETFERLLTDQNALSYRTILANGVMTGFVVTMLEEDGVGHITTIGVAPEHRRRGLGFRLLERIENIYRERGVSLMRLEVRSTNVSAQLLYQRAGYAVTQRLPRYYASGADGLLMVKSLV